MQGFISCLLEGNFFLVTRRGEKLRPFRGFFQIEELFNLEGSASECTGKAMLEYKVLAKYYVQRERHDFYIAGQAVIV